MKTVMETDTEPRASLMQQEDFDTLVARHRKDLESQHAKAHDALSHERKTRQSLPIAKSTRNLYSVDAYKRLLAEAEREDRLVVVFFTDTKEDKKYRACKRMEPVYEAIQSEGCLPYVIFATVDVEGSPELAEHCGVELLPTFRFFRGQGRASTDPIDEYTGSDAAMLRKILLDHGQAPPVPKALTAKMSQKLTDQHRQLLVHREQQMRQLYPRRLFEQQQRRLRDSLAAKRRNARFASRRFNSPRRRRGVRERRRTSPRPCGRANARHPAAARPLLPRPFAHLIR